MTLCHLLYWLHTLLLEYIDWAICDWAICTMRCTVICILWILNRAGFIFLSYPVCSWRCQGVANCMPGLQLACKFDGVCMRPMIQGMES